MKTHVTTERHWVIEEVNCPQCQSAKNSPCIQQEGGRGQQQIRYPWTTVHAVRVLAAGHNVRCI